MPKNVEVPPLLFSTTVSFVNAWRPEEHHLFGPQLAPLSSRFSLVSNGCQSSVSENTCCFHIIDLANRALGLSSVSAIVGGNDCSGSRACTSLEHADDLRVVGNQCSGQAFGIELHDSSGARAANNGSDFADLAGGCEIRTLAIGKKIDFGRVSPGAGVCMLQR